MIRGKVIVALSLFLLLTLSVSTSEILSRDGSNFSDAITVFDSREEERSGGTYNYVGYRESTFFRFYAKKWQNITVILGPEEDDQDLFLYDTKKELMSYCGGDCESTKGGTRWEFLRFLCIESGYYYARVYGYHSGHFAIIVSTSITDGMLTQIIQNLDYGFGEALTLACQMIPDLTIQMFSIPGTPSLQGTNFDYPIFINNNGYPEERSIGAGLRHYYYFIASHGDWVEIKLETLVGDADLYIYDIHRDLIVKSTKSGTTTDRQTIVIEKTGKYYIVVEGYQLSRYSLSCTKS